MSKYITVVFEINNEESFKEKQAEFHEKMLDGKGEPWRVTAMSLDNEMARLSLMEDARDFDDFPFIFDEIANAVDVTGKTVDDFCEGGD